MGLGLHAFVAGPPDKGAPGFDDSSSLHPKPCRRGFGLLDEGHQRFLFGFHLLGLAVDGIEDVLDAELRFTGDHGFDDRVGLAVLGDDNGM